MPPRKGKKATQARGVPESDQNNHTKNHVVHTRKHSKFLQSGGLFPSLKDIGRIFITLPPMQGISPPSSPQKSTETHTEQQPESPLSNFFPSLRQHKDAAHLNMVYKLPPLPGFSPPSSPLKPSERTHYQKKIDSSSDSESSVIQSPPCSIHSSPSSQSFQLSPHPEQLPLDHVQVNNPIDVDVPQEHYHFNLANTVPEEIKSKWENMIPPQQQTFLQQNPQITTHAAFGSVYVFNRIFLNIQQEKKTRDNWTVWKGPQLWTLVADLMNWNPGPSPDNIRALSWFGNGSDCGVELTEILIDLILATGMRIDERGIWPLKPHLSCSHVFREQMLYQILPSVKEAYFFWKANHNQNIPEVTHWNNDIVMDQTKHRFESGLENIKSLEPAQEISFQSPSNPTGYQDEDQDQDLNPLLPDDAVDILTCNFQNIVQRKRHTKAPFIDMSKVKQKIIRIDPNFDDYNTGPTIQETMVSGLSGLTMDIELIITLPRHSSPNFQNSLRSIMPINHQSGDHVLPESLKRWDLTCRNNTREAISDICFLGMQKLLELAGDRKSGNGFDLFIRGIRYDPEDCEKEEMVHLDITRDAVPTENVPVYISVDIDSLIWKTHHLHLKASINIHMTPYMQAKPPINTHNRTYVNLLKPQTDIQQANNEYTTYDRFKVSSILHIHFGYLQGGINVWIAFPRMTHKQQDSPYFATQIPLLVQDRWFAFILIPAIKKIYGRGSKEYVNHSSQEYKARAAGKTETRLVDRIKLHELQDQIHTIIREDRDEDLHIFGSFFFIMDIRGIKLTNKDRDHLGNDPFEVLADVIPALDFDYMSKPENGECVIDLGISASPEADQPMLEQTLLASSMLALLQIMVQYLQNIPLIVLQLSR
ncbi:hypothetical protein M422DRAFT_264263 [Sphaerobolus stellatus SS14]|uniref:Uncharacterized protein n=1 Tax=Sphaerobolus stellatus (strain SS14) TaxID=990650 RepID=A0A0C9V901_SPHS4|nr:hypothetical protein M422DRAFT_264263 [Sphaerobolus stellatus SS14]